MTVTIDIPDQLAHALMPDGGDLSRTALEAMALEGYRQKRLGESQMRRLLGFGTRMEVYGFLKEHDVYLNYGMEDAEHDLAEVRRYGALMQADKFIGHRPA